MHCIFPRLAQQALSRLTQPHGPLGPSTLNKVRATVKRIVECHGGHIEIAASGPHGTTFVVTLPRAHTSTTSPDARP